MFFRNSTRYFSSFDLHLCSSTKSATVKELSRNPVERPDIPVIQLVIYWSCQVVMSESQLSQDFQSKSKGKKSAEPDITSEQGTLVEENVFATLEEVQVYRTSNVLPS